jgi:hypothetical protein
VDRRVERDRVSGEHVMLVQSQVGQDLLYQNVCAKQFFHCDVSERSAQEVFTVSRTVAFQHVMCVFTGELLRRSISGASSGAIVRDLDLTQLKNALFGKCPLPVNG